MARLDKSSRMNIMQVHKRSGKTRFTTAHIKSLHVTG